jgi:hypothetical protein
MRFETAEINADFARTAEKYITLHQSSSSSTILSLTLLGVPTSKAESEPAGRNPIEQNSIPDTELFSNFSLQPASAPGARLTK